VFQKIHFSKFLLVILATLLLGLLLPQSFTIPVSGATAKDYNANSFWYYPWGKSVTHKGVDIFAKKGTPVVASTSGLVVRCGNIAMGGNIVLVLGPKWRFHYYTHLQDITTSSFSWLRRGEVIGTVGDTGNAAGKPPHLHYAIVTALPYPWRWDDGRQGWKKMFYLNPIDFLKR
jgi:murein DD-endopeptidase MepM/ murein hydrolase activator NlpD